MQCRASSWRPRTRGARRSRCACSTHPWSRRACRKASWWRTTPWIRSTWRSARRGATGPCSHARATIRPSRPAMRSSRPPEDRSPRTATAYRCGSAVASVRRPGHAAGAHATSHHGQPGAHRQPAQGPLARPPDGKKRRPLHAPRPVTVRAGRSARVPGRPALWRLPPGGP